MTILRVKRFLQDPGHCAIAAASEVSNFYDKTITYEHVRDIAKSDGNGMYTAELAILLNSLGFKKITIVSADVSQLDFAWKDFSKTHLIDSLKKSIRKNKDKDYKSVNKIYVKFLSDTSNDNQIIIDHQFGKYIREAIDRGVPVLASFNWNMFFKWTKWNENGQDDPITGESEEHEIVICGYDDNGVSIVDSHHEMYKGKLKQFKNGRYKMPWETLMTVMGYGDLVIPEGFLSKNLEVK